jgi:hypothetical protein
MYARHKPGHDWDESEGLPDFSKIKLESQSFNWNIFSIPIWTRFNDKKEYFENYAVVGFSVETIRYTFKYNPQFQDHTLGLDHLPVKYNYSHCQLRMNRELNKLEKRELRLILKNKSVVPLKPNQKQGYLGLFKDILKMFYYKLYSRPCG